MEPATDPTVGEWTETMDSPSDLSGRLDEAWLRCSPQNNPTPGPFAWKRSLNHDGVWLHAEEGGMDGSVQQACMDSLFGETESKPTGEWAATDTNGLTRWQRQDGGTLDIIWRSEN